MTQDDNDERKQYIDENRKPGNDEQDADAEAEEAQQEAQQRQQEEADQESMRQSVEREGDAVEEDNPDFPENEKRRSN